MSRRYQILALRHAAFLATLALLQAGFFPFPASARTDSGGGAPGSGIVAGAADQPAGTSPLIVETSRGTFEPERPLGPSLVHLGAGYSLDPSARDPEAILPPALRAVAPRGDERGYFLVQFRGPLTEEDRASVERHGGRIISYIPNYAFLVSLPASSRAPLAQSARVSWIGLYQPAYKISTLPQMQETGLHDLLILLFPDESLAGAAEAIRAAGGTIEETSENGVNKLLRVQLDLARLVQIAQIPAVAWIEPHQIPQWHNDACQWVVQTWTPNNRHLWTLGIKGQQQVLSLADSGIRTTHFQFYDSSAPITTFGDYPAHRKIIAYKKTVESTDITFGDNAGNSYHGTHTSCTAAGDDSPNGSDARDGMAINAKIYFLDGGGTSQPGVFIPLDLNDMFILPYNGNAAGAARVMSNSWGNPNGGAYDLQSMNADQFMWNHPDFLLCFSNGNDGTANSVGSPATAKNVVSVGGTLDGNSANSIYTWTSRGPTDDGRIKPTVCAPATLYSANGANNNGYVYLEGTSMASPATAGAAVLLRQYLTDGWYPTGGAVAGNAVPAPSAALLKAMAINSADTGVGAYTVPDNNVGWGRIDDENVCYFAGDARRLAVVENSAGLLTGEYVEYRVNVAGNAIPLKASLVWTDYAGTPAAAIELVNDLNLTASDGTNTYMGNVYSGGQSATGGTADIRNVEECVRRNTPNIGIWTFRIDAVNVPIGPQPFALVITGDLGSDAAVVTLDQVTYGGSDNLGIRVVDTNAAGSVSVSVTSNTEPAGETVVLSGSNGVYTGGCPLTLNAPAGGNGSLSVSDGDQITVTYHDANPVATLTASAHVNISGPAISDVHASSLGERDVTLAWTTTAASDSRVYYGTTPALGSTATAPALVASHAVALSNLASNTLYYYDVESYDNQGNGVRDDNGGAHYTFSTDSNRDILLVIGDATFTRKDYYANALTRNGWTYSVWEGAQAATPFVGNLTSGMASFKAVIWQTGFEQYPMFNDVARDSIARLDLLGSRLAVFSHDVAWDFSDPTSPDYTAARKAWFENELKATWQVDPTTFSSVLGYAGDPISGSYTSGIPYTPIRDGGAGDEVNGISTGGSFANVWRDNSTPDDIAIRWTSSGNVGDPARAVWGGTPRKVSSNFFEWAQLNPTVFDDLARATILDKTLIWLIGHDHPTLAVTAPNGGEIFTGSTVSISWTEAVDTGYAVGSRKIYYSSNGGDSWTLITAAGGPSPFVWDISAVPNGGQYRVRVVLADNGTPPLSASDASNASFTLNRPGGDTRGPVVLAGSVAVTPNPILVPNPATLTATISDVYSGNSIVTAAEWSNGPTPAPAGTGTAMSGAFASAVVAVTANLDSNALNGGSETLWVRGRDAAGNWGNAGSLVVQVNGAAAAVEDGQIPRFFALHQSSPNPFGPETSIRFDLPRPSQVLLEVYDVGGRLVRTLADGPMSPGGKVVAWDGSDARGRQVGSGVYFYRMHAGAFEATRKMTILR